MTIETKITLAPTTIAVLQDLIQINLDSRNGFAEAAENVDDPPLAAMFRQLAAERNEQTSELRTLVSANRQPPADEGSLAAAVHRTWMDLRAAIGGGAAAMLAESQRGENFIKAKYEEALRACHGSPVCDMLSRHYGAILKSHDRVRELRDLC
jgi:uncharacterized protein (TIGR02284 family)